MNYLDLLPNDVMKLVNREVEKAHIIKRRIERKRNRKINREQKRTAERKRYVYENFARLYNTYTYNQEYIEYLKRVDDKYTFTQRLYKEIRPMLLHLECIGGDEPYIIATLCINGKIVNIKFV